MLSDSNPDAVKETRELLSRLNAWPDSIIDIKHALFADAVERERDSPFFGCSTPVADLYGRAPELLKTLADEVERLRDWKESALPLLNRYENLAETFGGKLGSLRVENLERGVAALRGRLAQMRESSM